MDLTERIAMEVAKARRDGFEFDSILLGVNEVNEIGEGLSVNITDVGSGSKINLNVICVGDIFHLKLANIYNESTYEERFKQFIGE